MKKGTIVLLLLAVGLGAFVYFYELRKKEEPAWKDESKAAFTVLADDVTSLTIRRSGTVIEFERRGPDWWLKQPLETQADSVAVETLIRDITSAKISRTLTTPAGGVGSYGLEPPAIVVEFKTKDGKSHSLRLGAKDFQGWSVYAQTDGGKDVYLIPVSLLTNSDKQFADWRDRTVVRFEPADVQWFELTNSSGRIRVVRRDQEWQLEYPRGARGDKSAIQSLLNSFSEAKAEAIVNDNAGDGAKFGLARPIATLRIGLKDGGERVLDLGKKKGKSGYMRETGGPRVFQVNSELQEKLTTKFADLREKRLVPGGTAGTVRIVVRHGDGQEVYQQNSEGEWKVVEPAEAKDKLIQGWRLLEPLDVRASEVIDSPSPTIAARLAKPAFVIVISDKEGKATTVSFSDAAGDKVYARTSLGPEIYVLKKDILKALGRKPSDLSL